MPPGKREHRPPGPDQAVYAISVAAELSGIGVQTLRLYEQHGLITPARSKGGTRRYSGADLVHLHRITSLAAQGVNLAGIARILYLEDVIAELSADNDRLRAERRAERE
ncbi:MerR family transcriptional regulator [Nocardia sp. 004]|uniref:MerR family transcriptional regulator n=1 Tax=Nocardia sp. 004 TaxID=3385978 RepID=UPI0039A27820